jgi:hypothetical protein
MKKTRKKAVSKRVNDWRPATLARMRKLIEEADPEAVEEMKWKKPSNPKGVPTWSHHGIICTGQIFKGKVKITFAKGALLKDPSRLFNASLEGNAMRAIDIGEGEKIDEGAVQGNRCAERFKKEISKPAKLGQM